jgi:hypothetical protein
MNRRVVLGILVTLLVVAGALTLGGYAYSMGLAQGALQNAQIVVPEGGAVTAPIYPYGAPFYHFGPGYGRWGFGLGPLGCIFPLLGFFLLFALFRGLFWHGPGWGRRGWGGPGGAAPAAGTRVARRRCLKSGTSGRMGRPGVKARRSSGCVGV